MERNIIQINEFALVPNNVYIDLPPIRRAEDEEIYTIERKFNDEFIREHFFHQGLLTIQQASDILMQATSILKAEDNVLRLESPLTSICF